MSVRIQFLSCAIFASLFVVCSCFSRIIESLEEPQIYGDRSGFSLDTFGTPMDPRDGSQRAQNATSLRSRF
ncbi:hypothetical protein BDZ45DRAFT_671698 [Acephala macrosclerotiorum]|nr:hypothetical protein BDZ45DRAFT_671698 [Acephala macrosclerotiorum]